MEEIIEEKLLTNPEAEEILAERKKEIELGFEQKNTLDYLKKYNKTTANKARKMIEELSKIPKLRERDVIKIVNLMPEDLDDLRLVMEKEYTNLTEEEKKLILEIVNS
ncbi:MAG: RNA polymerase Rpb4 family protein [Candidatus Aenigmatarchaeota archaeon]